jgi:hypothetical protein
VTSTAKRISEAIRILRSVNVDIENEWACYVERPAVAKSVEAIVEQSLLDLERCAHIEAPALDKFVAKTPLARADVVRETFDRR